MKYLIKHRIEFIITIVWFVILAYVLYDGIKNGREVQSIIETVFGVTVWYKNMPTSIEGHNHKVELKEDKAMRGYEVDTVEEPLDSEVM